MVNRIPINHTNLYVKKLNENYREQDLIKNDFY